MSIEIKNIDLKEIDLEDEPDEDLNRFFTNVLLDFENSLTGYGKNFRVELFNLLKKADSIDLYSLSLGYPAEVATFEFFSLNRKIPTIPELKEKLKELKTRLYS